MITKLKYAGVPIEDLLNIYILFVRSVTEYCAVAFHPSLNQDKIRNLEIIQKNLFESHLGGNVYLLHISP